MRQMPHYTTCLRWREQGEGFHSLPLIPILQNPKRVFLLFFSLFSEQDNLEKWQMNVCEGGGGNGRRNFKDTNPLMSSLLVIFVWGGEAIL